jgi:hypothetical protein
MLSNMIPAVKTIQSSVAFPSLGSREQSVPLYPIPLLLVILANDVWREIKQTIWQTCGRLGASGGIKWTRPHGQLA